MNGRRSNWGQLWSSETVAVPEDSRARPFFTSDPIWRHFVPCPQAVELLPKLTDIMSLDTVVFCYQEQCKPESWESIHDEWCNQRYMHDSWDTANVQLVWVISVVNHRRWELAVVKLALVQSKRIWRSHRIVVATKFTPWFALDNKVVNKLNHS